VKVATPELAVTDAVPVSVPEPETIAAVTVPLAVVMMFP